MGLNSTVEAVTEKIRRRSQPTRQRYLARMQRTRNESPPKQRLSCGNLAHGFAACGESDKQSIRLMQSANLGIITAYNDMLSAHQPFGRYPELIKSYAREMGSTAQIAGGVPAMCDGVTQGQAGMEMSLFSRDLIAMATAMSLSHNLFDGILCLGVCDKIVPGMLIGALEFGHLPAGFIAAGPMPSGISNQEKASVRQKYAEGKADKDQLLAAESASYHSPGTCTFYGTANSNQVIVEMLGVQLPGASFINPDDPLRDPLTKETVQRVIKAADTSQNFAPLTKVITEESIVNALVGLLATGGSTNHTLHLIAIASAAGIKITWQDFDTLSKSTPLLVRVYPNGNGDVNDFQKAGGMAFLMRELRSAGLLNENVTSLMGEGLEHCEFKPELADASNTIVNRIKKVDESGSPDILRRATNPFDKEGGIRLLRGNLGESVIKISAVKPEHRKIAAPCIIFHSQEELKADFEKGKLDKDFVAVVRFQGPMANGMPELHQLTPYLGVLQDRGFKIALITDGRMSGASGKVPSAIHLSPEALDRGPIAKLKNGDLVVLDADKGMLNVEVDSQVWQTRECAEYRQRNDTLGRNLFAGFRELVGNAKDGASVLR
ncbi:phosphogluconate dehydratase [Aurantivibrio infirmus]